MILSGCFHRWLALGVLAAARRAVGRVETGTIYRVLTFMALLVTGFIYNKFHEAIRKWL